MLETRQAIAGQLYLQQDDRLFFGRQENSAVSLPSIRHPTRVNALCRLEVFELPDGLWSLRDELSSDTYLRSWKDLYKQGLYLNMPAYGYHLFSIEPASLERRCLIPMRELILSMAWSPDGQVIASSGLDRQILFRNIDGQEVHKPQEVRSANVTALAWSWDGRFLAAGMEDGSISYWDSLKRHFAKGLYGHRDAVLSLAWAPNKKYLASGSRNDGQFYLWESLERNVNVRAN